MDNFSIQKLIEIACDENLIKNSLCNFGLKIRVEYEVISQCPWELVVVIKGQNSQSINSNEMQTTRLELEPGVNIPTSQSLF